MSPETALEPPLPFFVYGSLRPGEAAFQRLLAPVAVSTHPAHLSGYAMFARTFPIIVPSNQPGAVIIGDLIVVDPTRFDVTVDALDRYEGANPFTTHTHYIRVIRTVELIPNEHQPEALRAWVYIGNRRIRTKDMRQIASGDWLHQ